MMTTVDELSTQIAAHQQKLLENGDPTAEATATAISEELQKMLDKIVEDDLEMRAVEYATSLKNQTAIVLALTAKLEKLDEPDLVVGRNIDGEATYDGYTEARTKEYKRTKDALAEEQTRLARYVSGDFKYENPET